MNGIEEKIGYLIAKVEEQGADIRKVTERFEALEKEVQDKFKTVEAAVRIFKFLGLATVTILTVPWVSIKAMFLGLFR